MKEKLGKISKLQREDTQQHPLTMPRHFQLSLPTAKKEELHVGRGYISDNSECWNIDWTIVIIRHQHRALKA